MKIFYMILLLGFCAAGYGQGNIELKVLSAETNQPLTAVSISDGNSIIAVTNNIGYAKFAFMQGTIIQISSSGYKTQTLNASPGMHIIRLETSVTVLDSVIVSTGYQHLNKEMATGSFERVDSKLYNRVVSTDILSRLEGIVPGIYFSKVSGPTEISIRGLSTLTASITPPLIIVDNFPYEGSINNINPNDVESITVLKDAAAASIWGARAGNGVIVISTRRGRYNQKPTWNISMNLSVEQKPLLMESPNFIRSPDFIEVEKFLFSKGYYDASINNTTSRPVLSPVVEILARRRANLISAADSAAQIGILLANDIRFDMLNYLYQRGLRRQVSSGVQGGSANINYSFSVGYDDNRSTVVNNSTRRLTAYQTFHIKLARSLELQTGINYAWTESKNNGLTRTGNVSRANLPYSRLADAAGNALSIPYTYRESYLDTAGAGLLRDWKYRPLNEINLSDKRIYGHDLLVRLGLKYMIMKSFSAEVKGQYEIGDNSSASYYRSDSYFARDLINRFSQRAGNTINYIVPNAGIMDKTDETLNAWGIRAQLNFHERLHTHNDINILAGAEARNTVSSAESSRTYGYDPETGNVSNMDFVSSYPTYGSIAGNAQVPNSSGFTKTTGRFVSLFANASYFYKKRYGITASLRKDASNLFGVATNDKWSPFWSAGVSWNIAEEGFFPFKIIDLLKLRSSFGYNGNVNPGIAAIPTINFAGANAQPNINLPSATIRTVRNSELRWEKSGIFNAGIDASAFNKKVSLSVEYYQRKSEDIIASSPVDPTTGFRTLQVNSAEIQTKGWDVKITVDAIRKKFKWNSTLIFNNVTNKVTKYYGSSNFSGNIVNYGHAISPRVGMDPYLVWSFKYAGLDSAGAPIGYLNGEKSKDYPNIISKTTWEDVIIHGSNRPPVYGSWINTMGFKGITVTANLQYKFNYYFRRNTIDYSSLYSSWSGHSDYYRRWQKPGDEKITDVPAILYPASSSRDRLYQNSQATVSKGDHIRLHDISLAYNTQNLGLKNRLLKNLELSVYFINIGILWRANKYGLDPDYGTGIPAPMTYTISLKKSF